MHRKAGVVLPLQEFFDEAVVTPAFLLEHLQNIGAEQFGQGMDINFRHHIENAVFPKQAVCQQHMDMGMPAGIITEGLYSHHRTEITFFQTGRLTKELQQALVDALTEFAQ